jgi:hypothetical protein
MVRILVEEPVGLSAASRVRGSSRSYARQKLGLAKDFTNGLNRGALRLQAQIRAGKFPTLGVGEVHQATVPNAHRPGATVRVIYSERRVALPR